MTMLEKACRALCECRIGRKFEDADWDDVWNFHMKRSNQWQATREVEAVLHVLLEPTEEMIAAMYEDGSHDQLPDGYENAFKRGISAAIGRPRPPEICGELSEGV